MTTRENTASTIRQRDFQLICAMVYKDFGIDLSGKEVLVAARLGKQMRKLGFQSFAEYRSYVSRDSSGEAMMAMIDALTTNHTSFFREPAHFEFLRGTVLPALPPRGAIRIWSSACSTGEEPYSIAFTIIEAIGDPRRCSILATDLSTRALAVAERGIYPAARFEQQPVERLRRHLLAGSGSSAGQYLVKQEVRAMIHFERLNLMEDFSHLGRFTVIFCRNVMIYFDRPTQEMLVNRLAERLEPGGYLFIGHAESLNGIVQPLSYVCPAVYRRLDKPVSESQCGRR